MSRSEDYIEALVRLAEAGRPDPLAAVLDARLRESSEAVKVVLDGEERELRPPKLGLHEPDHIAVLYEVCDVLAQGDAPMALESWRRTLVELLMRGLNRRESLEYLNGAARLIGAARVVDSPDTGRLLQQQLCGFLETHLPRPFDHLIELDGEQLALATLAVDVWVAVMPIEPEWAEHHKRRVEKLVDTSLHRLDRGDLPLEPRLSLLMLAYRALVRVRPRTAGAELWRLCKLVERFGKEQPKLRRRWLGMCKHQGMVFAQHREWRQVFFDGVRDTHWNRTAGDVRIVWQQTLKKLEMWGELKRSQQRPQSKVVQFSRSPEKIPA